MAPAAGLGQHPRCEGGTHRGPHPGQDWWSLDEATGPASLLRSELEAAAAALVFAQALPLVWNPARINPGLCGMAVPAARSRQ
ncbi:MAG: hypothetical protein ACLP5E_10280 [Streptosporangiaceae bacterium]